jgi:hypothetical protein
MRLLNGVPKSGVVVDNAKRRYRSKDGDEDVAAVGVEIGGQKNYRER